MATTLESVVEGINQGRELVASCIAELVDALHSKLTS